MAIDATIGGSASNSYVTRAEATTYFANHYSLSKSVAWAALTITQQDAALLRATQIVDGIRVLDTELGSGALPVALVAHDMYDLTIHRQMVGQILSFPRNIDLDINSAAFIPQAVKDSECEQAIFLIAFDDSALQTQMQGILSESVQAGPVSTSTHYGAAGAAGSYVSPIVMELMHPFIRPTRRLKRA